MEDLTKIDYLLGEMRRWWEAGRIPPALLKPLYDEFTARRSARRLRASRWRRF
jgi:hypothetical protein